MKTGLTQNEKIFALATLSVFVAFFMVFKKLNFKTSARAGFDSVSAIDYNMARPEQSYSGYSLDGREIDSEYEGLKPKAPPAVKTAAAKAKDDKNKKDKKATAKASSPKANAQAAGAMPKGVIQPLKSIASTDVKHTASNDSSDSSPAPSHDGYSSGQRSTSAAANAAQADTNTASGNTDDTTKNKKSYSQWRSEIFASPTQATMTAFITAYRKGEVTATEYQAMAQDLLEQNNSTLKGLALMALRAQPSLQSLSQMVHAESQLSTDLQTYAQQAYLSYFQSQNIQYLNQALQTSDKTLITKSLSLLSTNLQKIKSGDVASFVGTRNLRDAASVSLSISNFKTLLPALSTLVSSKSEYAGAAQLVANLIQANSTSNVASN